MESKFVQLYHVLTRLSEKNILTTRITKSQETIDKECTIHLDWIGYLQECTSYLAHLSQWDIILGEPDPSTINTQISAFKKPVSIQPSNMQGWPLTVWHRLNTQDSVRLAAIINRWQEATDYLDEDEGAIIIAFSKVDE